MDGRYENQKQRLMRLGLKRLYILEEDSLPKDDPDLAKTKAEVLLQGFVVVETEGSKHTARKLEQLTRLIMSQPARFKPSLTLSELNRFRKTVNPTAAQAWAAMLSEVPEAAAGKGGASRGSLS